MVHAFITSRLHYCNGVLHGVSTAHLRPLEKNVRYSLLRRKQRLDYISAEAVLGCLDVGGGSRDASTGRGLERQCPLPTGSGAWRGGITAPSKCLIVFNENMHFCAF